MSAVLEKSLELPEGWEEKNIGDLCTIVTGKLDVNQADEGGKYPFFTCAQEIYAINDYAFDTEAVLVAGNGFFNVKYYKGKFNAYQRTYVLHDINVDAKYLYYLVEHRLKKITSGKRGSTIQYIRLGDLRDHPVWIAPAEQQKRIVAKIEELFSHIDAGIEVLKKAKQLLKQYRQSVLKAAVTGELTKEWREANNISLESWEDSTIGEVAIVQTGKTPKRTSAKFWENGTIPWLTSAATNEAFTHQAGQFVTQAAVDEGLKLFEPGTLLLAMYGEGKTRGQVTEITFQVTCNQACAAILVDESKASRAFVRLRLYENYEETRKAASGGNQPNLNLSKVRDISLPLPSLTEQSEIVAHVDTKFDAISRLENELDTQLYKAEKNKQSILASAFSGNLNQG